MQKIVEHHGAINLNTAHANGTQFVFTIQRRNLVSDPARAEPAVSRKVTV